MRQVYRITFPKRMIYVGPDLTYMGSPSQWRRNKVVSPADAAALLGHTGEVHLS